MFNRNLAPIVLISMLGIAVAAGSSYSLVVNGQISKDTAIVVGGKTYVPLAVLKSLGVNSSLKGSTLTLSNSASSSSTQSSTQGGTPSVTAGGTNQRASLEGCIGETLFNGVWRLTVKSIEQIVRSETVPGWGVTLEWKNGTKATAYATMTGVKNFALILANGNPLEINSYDAQQVTDKDLQQGAGVTHQLKFYFPPNTPLENLPRPAKLLVEIDPKGITAGSLLAAGVAYTTPNPSFRVRLDCQK
jgi:hypothetical protein